MEKDECKYKMVPNHEMFPDDDHESINVKRRKRSYNILWRILSVFINILVVISITLHVYEYYTNHEMTKKMNNITSELAEFKESFRNQLSVMEGQLDKDEDTIIYHEYLLNFTANLTQLHTDHSVSIAELKQGNVTNKHLLSKIEQLELKMGVIEGYLKEPYKNCKTSKSSCIAGTKGNGAYWKACATDYILTTIPVSA